jgi:hypothetical protein
VIHERGQTTGSLHGIDGLLPVPLYPPGVFFICKGDAVIYVGKSHSPPRGVAGWAQWNSKVKFDRAYALPVPIEEQQVVVKDAFIRTLNPKLNSRGRGGGRCPEGDPEADRALLDRYRFAPKVVPRAAGYLGPIESLLRKWLRPVRLIPVWAIKKFLGDKSA